MRPVTLTQTGVGSTAPIPLDHRKNPFAVSLAITVSGTVTYSVEHTLDDVFATGFDPSTATWFAHDDLSAKTVSEDGNYAFPVRATRLTVSAGSGSASLTVLQAGA